MLGPRDPDREERRLRAVRDEGRTVVDLHQRPRHADPPLGKDHHLFAGFELADQRFRGKRCPGVYGKDIDEGQERSNPPETGDPRIDREREAVRQEHRE